LLRPGGANNRRSSSASSIPAGTGQVIPITDVRRKYSATVVRPMPTERAMVRTLAPHAYFSRNTSRTFRIDNLSPGIAVLLGSEDHATGHRIVDFDLNTLSGLSAINRNHSPASVGISGRLPFSLGFRKRISELLYRQPFFSTLLAGVGDEMCLAAHVTSSRFMT
jgi:hypothetical protein